VCVHHVRVHVCVHVHHVRVHVRVHVLDIRFEQGRVDLERVRVSSAHGPFEGLHLELQPLPSAKGLTAENKLYMKIILYLQYLKIK
jgi:hypothetical protein